MEREKNISAPTRNQAQGGCLFNSNDCHYKLNNEDF